MIGAGDCRPASDATQLATASPEYALRLLIVGNGLSGGGAQTRFRLLARHLFGGTADIAPLIDAGSEALGVGQAYIPLGWSGRTSYLTMLRRLRRAVRSNTYDAVLAFGLFPNMLAWVAVKGLRPRPALILTEITRPDTEGRLSGFIRHIMRRWVRRASYRQADLCAANSEDGLAEVVRFYGVDPARIRRVPNLVEPERLAALAAQDIATDVDPMPTICAVARLDPLKRIDTLLRAAAMLPKGLAWRIEILGDGPARGELEALAADLAIADRVRFRGWVANPYPAMRRATVVALTSAYEGFSNTVLEAMALGTPVITSYCSADARLMCEEGAALGFPVDDEAALLAHLECVITDANARSSLINHAARYIRRHEVPDAVREYEKLVLDAVDVHARSSAPVKSAWT